MITIEIILAAAGGFIVGVLVTMLIYQSKVRRLRSSQPSAAMQSSAGPAQQQFFSTMQAAHNLTQKTIEVIDSNVTPSDVQRQSRVGLEYHLTDLIEEVKEFKTLNHLMRIVINGYNDPLWEQSELRDYLFEFHKDHPEAIFFIEENSLATYLRIIREAKMAHFSAPLDDQMDLEAMKRELFQDKESLMNYFREQAHLFFSKIIEDDREAVIRLVDESMERIGKALETVF
ncbi:MAG: hypothetical protein Kow0059_08640 [Candidatus Sumerlaeia bacterium]